MPHWAAATPARGDARGEATGPLGYVRNVGVGGPLLGIWERWFRTCEIARLRFTSQVTLTCPWGHTHLSVLFPGAWVIPL